MLAPAGGRYGRGSGPAVAPLARRLISRDCPNL